VTTFGPYNRTPHPGDLPAIAELRAAGHVPPVRPPPPHPLPDAERADRLAEIFARWQTEDVTGEPDWDPEAIEPFALRP
jgi:hypothetical protein